MKVFFVGAGPGASDLITVRGAKILAQAKLVLYAGSLVPSAVLEYCSDDAEIIDTSGLDLDQQVEHYLRAKQLEFDVARVHSGDPSIYGATAEQMRRLELADIAYEMVPGVSSFTAAAAALSVELTKPEVSQSIILTRVSGRASAVPELESIARFAEHRATMCIFLSGPHLKKIVSDLLIFYPATTPVALVYRASWPDQRKHSSTLGALLSEVDIQQWKLTTMMLVGQVLNSEQCAESSLYSAGYKHLFRNDKISVEEKFAPTERTTAPVDGDFGLIQTGTLT
jgi:precorrin-4/cobalt-precorrin-4 C11-methyltransferase